MKNIREKADSAMTAKLRRLGASGDKKFAMKGASCTDGKTKGYATGGVVGGGAQSIDGTPARPNLARPGRSAKGGKKKGSGKTNVNVIIMPKGGDDGAKPPMPPMDMPPSPPPMAKPPMPMPPPGPPPGGPPMMRAKGGRVSSDMAEDKKMMKRMVHAHEKGMHKGKGLTKLRKMGGKVDMKAGAGGGLGRLEKIKKYGV